MSAPIRLSIALLTRNRTASLCRCLASLRVQDAQPWEIVISDDSDPAPAEVNRAIAGEFGARHIVGPRRGLYANRNMAALACEGTHIRTMDDDHTFPPGHIARCLEAISSAPDTVWACGEMSYVDGAYHTPPCDATQLHPSGVGGPVSDPNDNWAIADGATIYPREVFASGLRMMEDFGYGSSYLEFGAYLYRHGFRSRLLRGTWVEHHAEAATLARSDIRDRLFASLCFNLHFHPNLALAAKYVCSYAVWRQPSLSRELPALLKQVRARWKKTS
jgi:glycosyltransferase involved in cell wall biosynthesis